MDGEHDGYEDPGSIRVRRGRGAVSNPAGRFQRQSLEGLDDGWPGDGEAAGSEAPSTELAPERARRVISYNRSPDIPFDRSINPYRGCEHGCIYCYARPSHAYLDLSPGIDFETRLRYKENAAERLRAELAAPGYRPAPIALGVNTDAWQPAERRLGVTRAILEVLQEHRHPVTVITKSGLIERDIELLAEMAGDGLVHASVSVTTLDPELHRHLEPRAAGPARRLRIIERLASAGIPVGVMVAPVIPAINDHELEAILAEAAGRGARDAGYVGLRLPHEVAGLFADWLRAHYPQRAEHVLSLIRQSHGGRAYDGGFGTRMRGQGPFAALLGQRFRVACTRHGLDRVGPVLETTGFRVPPCRGDQLGLFGDDDAG
ncbi:MAG: PA0069 family radical SAM protein [Arhodomonas sp.]|nr:PA0069 family radical SAM protein [Arhodomonas sp.]